MDASTFTTAIVQMISAVATGVARRVGNQAMQDAAEQIYGIIRKWAENSELGRAALTRFEEQPDELSRQELLRSVLEDAINSDPALAHQLHETAAGYVAAQESIIGGSQHNVSVSTIRGVRGRNQVSIGPMTITNNRQARISLAAIAMVLLLLIVFGIYGTVRTFDGHSGSARPVRQPARGSGVPKVAPSVEAAPGDIYKATQRAMDLNNQDGSESHLDITVRFGVVNTDYSICSFHPQQGATVIPFTVSVSNRVSSTANYDTPEVSIASLNGAAVYIVSSPFGPENSLRTCALANDVFMSPYIDAPGPQQQEDFYFELAGVPQDSLSSSGVAIWLVLGDKGDYTWNDLPASAKTVVKATVQ